MFRWVTKKEYAPAKRDVIELINLVQDEIRDKFTFQFHFIGSVERNMVTMDEDSNIGYDFDVNIEVNDDDNEYSAAQIRRILKAGFDKYVHLFQYDPCEDSTRVLTIKVKDKKHSKILHSVDFAVVNNYGDDQQEYIRFNKKQNTYEWCDQPEGYYKQKERIIDLKNNGFWNEVRDTYLDKKNNNPQGKKSRALFAEAVNEVYLYYFEE